MGRFFSWRGLAGLGGAAFNKVRGLFGGASNPNALSTADKLVLHSDAGKKLVDEVGTDAAGRLLKEITEAKKPNLFQRMWKPMAGIFGLGLATDAAIGGRDSLVGKGWENIADGAKKIDAVTDTNALFTRWGNFLNNIYKFLTNLGGILRGEVKLDDLFSEKGKETTNSNSPVVNAAKAVGDNLDTAAVVAAPAIATSVASRVITGSWNPLSFFGFGRGPKDGGDMPGGGDSSGGRPVEVKSTPLSETEFEAAKRSGQGDMFDTPANKGAQQAVIESAEKVAVQAEKGLMSNLKSSFKRSIPGILAIGAIGFFSSKAFAEGDNLGAVKEGVVTAVPFADAADKALQGDATGAQKSAIVDAGAWGGFAAGAAIGGAIGVGFFGLGAIPGSIVGGVVGMGGSIVGSMIGEKVADTVVQPTSIATSSATPAVEATSDEVASINGKNVDAGLDLGEAFASVSEKPRPSLADFQVAVSMSEISVPEPAMSGLSGDFSNARDNKKVAAANSTPAIKPTGKKTRYNEAHFDTV